MHRLFVLLICFSFGLKATSQTKVAFHAPDSMSFVLIIQDTPINNTHATDITLIWPTPGKTKVKMDFLNPELTDFEQIVEFKPLMFQEFEMRKVKNKMQYFTVAESPFSPLVSAAPIDSLIAEMPAVASAPEYAGQSNCQSPISDVDFQTLKNELHALNFEVKKYEFLKSKLTENCFRVDQIRYMLAQLALEDNKIKLLEVGKASIYDFDHAHQIVDDFFLDRNKNKAKAILQ
jgi:hypothetical protein